MANYEKQVEQEAAYPIPISLYNCYRTVRHEKRGIAIIILLIAFLMPHCPVTVVQRYRDGVLPSLYPPSFRRNFILVVFVPLPKGFQFHFFIGRCPYAGLFVVETVSETA